MSYYAAIAIFMFGAMVGASFVSLIVLDCTHVRPRQ